MIDGHGFGLAGGFMWLFWLLLIVVIVWVIKAIVSANSKTRASQKLPLEILQERLARGEIDEAEFERKRKLLQG